MSGLRKGQAPIPGQPTVFLNPLSSTTQRSSFIGSSIIGSSNYATTSVTLQATGDATNQDFGTFTVSFSYTIDGNTWPWESILAHQYSNFYVDGSGTGLGFDSNLYRRGSNVAGSTAPLRKTMLIDILKTESYVPEVTAYSGYSSVVIYYVKNNDSSSHQIGITSIWKYIVTGGLDG